MCASTSACGEGAPADDTTVGVAPELSEAELFPAITRALREAGTYEFEMTHGPENHRVTMSGSARVRETGLDLAAASTTGPPVEVRRMATGDVFIKAPDAFGHELWIERTMADGTADLGIVGAVTGAEFLLQDPDALDGLEVVGVDTIDGTPVDHYRCVIEFSKLLDHVGAEPLAGADETIVAELWIDSDNLLRRFVLTPEFAVTSAFDIPTEGTYSDFGTDVDIQAPPASDVTEQPGM